MEKREYQLGRLSGLMEIGILQAADGQLKVLGNCGEDNPVFKMEEFRELLTGLSEKQEEPLLYQDANQVFFGCVKTEKGYFLFGPMSIKRMTSVELHRYYKLYGMGSKTEKHPPVLTLSKILGITEMIASEVLDAEYQDEELIKANHLAGFLREDIERDQAVFRMREEKAESYHHTYQEEQELLNCVREGRVQDAMQYSMHMDTALGRLSAKELNHWKYVAVVSVTLCARAAIEGGVPPAVAYQVSDFYIQKCEEYEEISSLISYRNQAVRDFTERVYEKQKSYQGSDYVEKCKDYIDKHYKEKIYLEEMAERMNISRSYLSKIFSKETGIRIQDYIVQVRVERAANLLLYSDESISDIGMYVNFPSQSYFGKIFKKYKGMTPGDFRKRFKPKEFSG